VADADLRKLKGQDQHCFHLAAIYDLAATAEDQQVANVEGTRHAVQFAEAVGAGCFHHVSSIAAAGLYDGVFREDMFERPRTSTTRTSRPSTIRRASSAANASGLANLPPRIRRRALADRLRRQDRRAILLLQGHPEAAPRAAAVDADDRIEGGRINIVPVDFVADAMTISPTRGLDGKCFHLTDPDPHRIGEVLNIFAKAGTRRR